MVALPASLSAWSFPFTSACPRQYVHRSLQVILQEKWDFIKRKVENIEEGGGKKKRVRSSFSLSEHWVLRLSVSCWFRCCCSVLGAVVLGVKAAVLCFHVCFVVLSTGWLQHQVWGLHVREDHTQVHDWWNVVTWISGWTGSLQLQVWYPQLSPLLSFVFFPTFLFPLVFLLCFYHLSLAPFFFFFSPFVFFLTVFTVYFLPLSLCCVFSSSQFLPFVFFLTAIAICLPLHSICYLSSSSQFLPFVFFLTAFAICLFPHSLCYVSSFSQFLPFIFFFTAFTIGLLSHTVFTICFLPHSLCCVFFLTVFDHLSSFLQVLPSVSFLTVFIICPSSSQVLVVFLSIQLLPVVFFSQFLPSSQLFPSVVYLAAAFFPLTLWALSSLFACVQHSPVYNLSWSKFRAGGCVWPHSIGCWTVPSESTFFCGRPVCFTPGVSKFSAIQMSPVKRHFSVADLSVLLQGWVNSVQIRSDVINDTTLFCGPPVCFTPRLSKFSADQVRCHQWYYTFLWPTCLFYSKAE